MILNYSVEIIKLIPVICLLAFSLFYIIQLIAIFPWRKTARSRMGKLVLKTASPKNVKGILVLIFCPVLVVLCLLTKATYFITIVMTLVAALGTHIVTKEIVFLSLNGIYENGICGQGRFIQFAEIDSFPDTSWKEPDKQNTTSLAVQLKAKKNQEGEIFFVDFATIVEYVNVVNAIKDLKMTKPSKK